MRDKKNTPETGTDETALAMTERGAMMPATFDDLVNAPGVSVVKTIKVGDPALGGIAGYAGAIIGPGEPVETTLEVPGAGGEMVKIKGVLPTWQCRPVALRKEGDEVLWDVVGNVTHVVITPHQMNAALTRIYNTAEKQGAVGKFAARWNGKKSIKAGRQQVNDYDVLEKYDAKPEASA